MIELLMVLVLGQGASFSVVDDGLVAEYERLRLVEPYFELRSITPLAQECMDFCQSWCDWPLSCNMKKVELYSCTTDPDGYCCAWSCCFDPFGWGCD